MRAGMRMPKKTKGAAHSSLRPFSHLPANSPFCSPPRIPDSSSAPCIGPKLPTPFSFRFRRVQAPILLDPQNFLPSPRLETQHDQIVVRPVLPCLYDDLVRSVPIEVHVVHQPLELHGPRVALHGMCVRSLVAVRAAVGEGEHVAGPAAAPRVA